MDMTLLFVGGLGGWEILLIILVLLIFFGAKKIPELARGLGKGIQEFKHATKQVNDEIENSMNEEPAPKTASKKEPVKESTKTD